MEVNGLFPFYPYKRGIPIYVFGYTEEKRFHHEKLPCEDDILPFVVFHTTNPL
jgi:hypothetical protein